MSRPKFPTEMSWGREDMALEAFVMGRIPNGFSEVKDAGVSLPSSKPFFLLWALSGDSFEGGVAAGDSF